MRRVSTLQLIDCQQFYCDVSKFSDDYGRLITLLIGSGLDYVLTSFLVDVEVFQSGNCDFLRLFVLTRK